jgi:hypothetical protein
MQLLSSLWRTDRLDTRCAVLQSQVIAPRAASLVVSSCLGEGVAFCWFKSNVKLQLWLCTRGWALETVWTFGDEKNLSVLLFSCRHHRAKGQTASSFTLSIHPLAVIQSPDPLHLVVLPALLCVYAQMNLVFVHLLFASFLTYFPQECDRY